MSQERALNVAAAGRDVGRCEPSTSRRACSRQPSRRGSPSSSN